MVLALLGILKHGQPNDTFNTKRLFRDAFVEFVATTLFIFSGTLSASSTGKKLALGQGAAEDVGRVLPIAMAFGISIMTLAYSIGHLTGGHMNPAVSLLMFFRRQMSATKMIFYWIAQFVGAILGASLTWGCVSSLAGDPVLNGEFKRPPFHLGANTLDPTMTAGNGFLLEFMGSVVFFFVIAQTALDKRGIADSMFPAIPIGFSLVVVHICLIPFTGCGVNPARTFGPSIVVCMAGGDCEAVMGDAYWIYWIGPFLASWAVAELTLIMEMDVDGVEAATAPKEIESAGEDAPNTDLAKEEQELMKEVANTAEEPEISPDEEQPGVQASTLSA
ncbi:Lens fiber major intrinsic protein [Seminavis robusta]|uniref:Lens fiber major intrinsic protein n=1 Tax=Seminavis robusta TaxID=568900 RepID=A0A9N8ERM5_9STRA|nr:Lens fiber major intrinsic protein [Seminavis robusta]|eukprot:Sro1751_g295280.1 Lens fiber major intrinsic protein (333) ;mRNA; f:8555-9667